MATIVGTDGQNIFYNDGSGKIKSTPVGGVSAPGPSGPTGPQGPQGPIGASATGLSYLDVADYGARAFQNNGWPAAVAGTINAASQSLSVSSYVGYTKGDGIVIYGAGATTALATPGTPTIIPSLARGIMGVRAGVAAPSGNTTYSYQIVARTKNGGLTAAGSAGSTSTGNTLGPNTVSISSISRSGNTVTIQTSAAHGVSPNALVFITGVADITFNGSFIVASVADTTHFTFTQGMNTINGASTSSSGGTVTSYNFNLVSWAAVSGAWQYYIYKNVSGTSTLVGVSRPNETSWEDYGSTFMANISLPDFVPTTAPVSAINEYLATTIVSGQGTNTWMIADTAVNSVANAVVKFDNGPCIANADAAASGSGGSGNLYISPSTNLSFYIVNSHTILSSKNIFGAGALIINETIETPAGSVLTGGLGASNSSDPEFAAGPATFIDVATAYPGLYSTGGGTSFHRLSIVCRDQGLGLFIDGDSTFNLTFTDCSFVSGSSADYMGNGLVIKGSTVISFQNCLFTGSSPNPNGTTYCPAIIITDAQSGTIGTGEIYFQKCFSNLRGIGIYDNNIVSGEVVQIKQHYAQGLVHPLLMMQTGNGQFMVDIDGFINDTSFTAVLANFGADIAGSRIANIPYGFGVTGNVINGLQASAIGIIGNTASAVMQNYNMFNFSYAAFQAPQIQLQSTPFANLPGTVVNGALIYCPDCSLGSSPCTGSGTGAIAKGLNGSWVC